MYRIGIKKIWKYDGYEWSKQSELFERQSKSQIVGVGNDVLVIGFEVGILR